MGTERSLPVCAWCKSPALRHDNEFDPWAEFACGSEFYGSSSSQSEACHIIEAMRPVVTAVSEAISGSDRLHPAFVGKAGMKVVEAHGAYLEAMGYA